MKDFSLNLSFSLNRLLTEFDLSCFSVAIYQYLSFSHFLFLFLKGSRKESKKHYNNLLIEQHTYACRGMLRPSQTTKMKFLRKCRFCPSFYFNWTRTRMMWWEFIRLTDSRATFLLFFFSDFFFYFLCYFRVFLVWF